MPKGDRSLLATAHAGNDKDAKRRAAKAGAGVDDKPRRGKFSKLLLIIGILLILAAAAIVGWLFWQHWQNQQDYQSVQAVAGANQPVAGSTAAKGKWNLDKTINWTALRKRNPEVVGWVVVPGTKINYPVVQSKNNQDYLHQNFDKQSSVYGCVFNDYQGDPRLAGQVNIIYGHDMRDGSMFAGLNKFTDASYLAKHRTIWLFTPWMTYQLQANKCKKVYGSSTSFRSRLADPLDPGKPKEYDFVTCWAPDDSYRVAIISTVINQKVPSNYVG
jgi:sortase B